MFVLLVLMLVLFFPGATRAALSASTALFGMFASLLATSAAASLSFLRVRLAIIIIVFLGRV